MTFRPQTRTIPTAEWAALTDKITDAVPIQRDGSYYGTTTHMVDDDFLPTQNMRSVRYLLINSYADCDLYQVDSTGVAVLLLTADT
jgi:hypothetical protein